MTSHAKPATHPHLRNTAAITGDALYAAGRSLLRAVDWVDRYAASILGVVVALLVVAGVALVLSRSGLMFPALLVFVVGVVAVTAVVAYKAGVETR